MHREPTSRLTKIWQDCMNEKPLDPEKSAGALIEWLCNLLGVEPRAVTSERVENAAIFVVDFGSINLNWMDVAIVAVTHPPRSEAESGEFTKLISEYRDAFECTGPCLHLMLEWSANPNVPIASSYSRIAYLWGEDLERLTEADAPDAVLFSIIRRQVRLPRLCPFRTTKEARGSMFKGRDSEINSLVNERDNNLIVDGARLIGKTSLLKEAYRKLRMRTDTANRAFYFDCLAWDDFWDFAHRLAHTIDPKKEQRIEAGSRNVSYLLRRLSSDGQRPLMFFFDEVDGLVEYESTLGWEVFDTLHEAVSHNWARVVFAGFRTVTWLVDDKKSPFFGRLQKLTLKPLSMGESESLICDTFETYGFRISEREDISRIIYSGSAGHPFLIQFYGQELFRIASQRSPEVVTLDDVAAVEAGGSLGRFLLSYFLMNTVVRGRPAFNERLCTFVYMQSGTRDGWTQGDFHQACKKYKELELLDINQALDNLCDACILTERNWRYHFTFPLLEDALRKSYPDLAVLINK